MATKSFRIRKVLLFPTEAQKLELEKLFFSTRLVTNYYNNKFNKQVTGYGKPKIMTYSMLGEQLARDIDALGGAPPGTLAQAAYLPSSILRPCLREIELLQQRANNNFNNPVTFIYPSDEQKFWIYDYNGLVVTKNSLIIPSDPKLQFNIDNNKIDGIVKLLRIIKTKSGDYEALILHEGYNDYEAEPDRHILYMAKQIEGIEYSDRGEKRNSYMRSRVRRNDDVGYKSFVFRRAIMLRLNKQESLLDPIEEKEEPVINIFDKE